MKAVRIVVLVVIGVFIIWFVLRFEDRMYYMGTRKEAKRKR